MCVYDTHIIFYLPITVTCVLLQSGVPVLSDPFKLSLIRDDPQQLESILAQQTPWKMGM